MEVAEKKYTAHNDGHRYRITLSFSGKKKARTCMMIIVSPDAKTQAKVVKTLSKSYGNYKVSVSLTESNVLAIVQIEKLEALCPSVLNEELEISAQDLFDIGQSELGKLKYSWS